MVGGSSGGSADRVDGWRGGSGGVKVEEGREGGMRGNYRDEWMDRRGG